MRRVTPEQAVAHPNWSMGAKISVDSATMMNKGLELIEAHHLFQLPLEQVDIVVHPQSIVHGAVVYRDGSVLAQLGSPDMRTPIAYALAWPDRIETPTKRLDLAAIGRLTFEAPDEERFPALRVAREALVAGGGAPTVLNAANETAVHAFLEGRIGFLDIVETVERTLAAIPEGALESLDDVYNFDNAAREVAAGLSRSNRTPVYCCSNGFAMIAFLHSGLSYIVPFLLVLTVLVFVHEFGHYFIARWNGVRVEVFSIGFGPELFGWWDRAGTRWKFSAIPLGGYVKMFGDSDASSGMPVAGLARAEPGRARSLVSL